MNLFLVLLFGLTILLGTLIVLINKNKKVDGISLGMAFSLLILLIVFELIPTAIEHINYLKVIGYGIVGILVIKFFDLFIPDHNHSEKEGHIIHLGIVASVALILHNIIEGMVLYGTLVSSTKLGILLGIGIGLHNIPMGMVIGTTLFEKNKSRGYTLFISLLISLSTFIGGLLIYWFSHLITEYTMGVLLSLTLGMLIYMVFFELLHHLKHQDKKSTLIGLVMGVVVFLLSLLFHSH